MGANKAVEPTRCFYSPRFGRARHKKVRRRNGKTETSADVPSARTRAPHLQMATPSFFGIEKMRCVKKYERHNAILGRMHRNRIKPPPKKTQNLQFPFKRQKSALFRILPPFGDVDMQTEQKIGFSPFFQSVFLQHTAKFFIFRKKTSAETKIGRTQKKHKRRQRLFLGFHINHQNIYIRRRNTGNAGRLRNG